MKKLRVLLVSLICIFCLTGCVRFNTTVTVKNNGKMDVSMLYAMMDMSDYGFGDDVISESDVQEYKDDGWDVEEYNQDGFRGYIISKKDVSASEFSSAVDDTETEFSEGLNSLSFTKDGLKYVLDWKLFDDEEGEQITAYKNFFTMSGGYMKLTVTLPVEPSASNATSVSEDGKTLEWDLLNLGPDQSIHLEFSLINIWLIVGICAAILAVLVVIILALVISAQKKKAAQAQNMGYPQQDYNPQYGSVPGFNPQQSQYNTAQTFNQQPDNTQYSTQNNALNAGQQYNTPESGTSQNNDAKYNNSQNYNPYNSQQNGGLQSSAQNTYQLNNMQNLQQAPNEEPQAQPTSAVDPQLTQNLIADELTKLKKLLDDGVITQEEFEAQKTKLLNR